jgi:hypothetical protein
MSATARNQATRQFAHLYLNYGLLPVPAWGITDSGACRCPRGPACGRPGKHPRSVHTGPGQHDYSWKPLTCTTHQDIEQRFARDGRYAGANLMLAIPEGMLVIDQDFDDGGRRALAALARQHGELPATLSHRTPHGTHRIYRTPPGWTTRAWVGKDAGSPLPPGIDVRVPGQILMAPPSRVPATDGPASYGPVTGTAITDLPIPYIQAWTPPRPRARPQRPHAAVPPGAANIAASYVHARINGIAEDLAGLEPGGRNTALYTAALKIGSTLSAARSTPGAGQAAFVWTDQAAEDALMTAAEHNGYIADHGAAAARSSIRSGLRNGLRNPRPLPDLGRYRAPADALKKERRGRPGLAADCAMQRASTDRYPSVSPNPDAANSERPSTARKLNRSSPGIVLASPEAEQATTLRDFLPELGQQSDTSDWRDQIIQKERYEWRHKPDRPAIDRPLTAEHQEAEGCVPGPRTGNAP